MCYISHMDFIIQCFGVYTMMGFLTMAVFAALLLFAHAMDRDFEQKHGEHLVENIIVAGIVWPGTLFLMVVIAITMWLMWVYLFLFGKRK